VEAFSDVLRHQARHFAEGGSPVYERLADALADDPAVAERIVAERRTWDGVLRLFGAVHDLVLTGAAPEALSGDPGDFAAALVEHEDRLRERVARQAVQTNEVRRCTGLLPAFLMLARERGLPLELLELGPSAGLNLLVDRYAYRYTHGRWGPLDAMLQLEADDRRGPVPPGLLATRLDVRRRRGVDLAPVDPTRDDGYLVLRSFLWAGRQDRIDRLDAAIAVLQAMPNPPELVAGNYIELLPELLAARPDDALTVVFQTASTGYLSPEDNTRLRSALEAAGADGRPLGWVSTRRRDERESDRDDRYELEVRLWPEPVRLVGYLDFHGNWLEWLA
jgi:hypothetical protein